MQAMLRDTRAARADPHIPAPAARVRTLAGLRRQAQAQVLRGLPLTIEDHELPEGATAAVSQLWLDAGVQACYRRSREYQLYDSASYLFDNVMRIGSADYTPSDEDILRCRVKSTGINEITYTVNDRIYKYAPPWQRRQAARADGLTMPTCVRDRGAVVRPRLSPGWWTSAGSALSAKNGSTASRASPPSSSWSRSASMT